VALWPVILLIIELVGIIITYIIEIGFLGPNMPMAARVLRFAGYNKAAISLFKYMPQVYLNYKRQSTVGWSLANVILDLTGGSFSLLQQTVDSVALGKPFLSGDGFNVIKFELPLTIDRQVPAGNSGHLL